MRSHNPTNELFTAITYDTSDFILRYLNEGADLNAYNGDKLRPIELAVKLGRWNIIKLIADHLNKESRQPEKSFIINDPYGFGHALVKSISAKKNDCTYSLIKVCANLEITDEAGRTPLYYAVIVNNFNLVLALLRKGACPNTPVFIAPRFFSNPMQKKDKEYPLHRAITEKFHKISALLLTYNADENLKVVAWAGPDRYREGAIHRADPAFQQSWLLAKHTSLLSGILLMIMYGNNQDNCLLHNTVDIWKIVFNNLVSEDGWKYNYDLDAMNKVMRQHMGKMQERKITEAENIRIASIDNFVTRYNNPFIIFGKHPESQKLVNDIALHKKDAKKIQELKITFFTNKFEKEKDEYKETRVIAYMKDAGLTNDEEIEGYKSNTMTKK